MTTFHDTKFEMGLFLAISKNPWIIRELAQIVQLQS